MLINLSSAMPDIIIDAAAAGLSRDNQERASDIQSLLNGALAMGGVIANGTSGWLVQWLHPQHVFLLCAIPPFLLVVSSMLRVLPEKRLPPCERKAPAMPRGGRCLEECGYLSDLLSCLMPRGPLRSATGVCEKKRPSHIYEFY